MISKTLLFPQILFAADAEGAPASEAGVAEATAGGNPAPEGGGEPKAAEGPAKGAPAPEPAEPLTAEALKLPEGVSADDPALGKLVEIFNAEGDAASPAARAQALLNLQADLAKAGQEAATQSFLKQMTDWEQELRADPEVGGKDFDANVGLINSFLDQHMTEGFADAMAETGAGNHPAVFRTMLALARAYGEGGPVTGAPPASGATKSRADVMFGTTEAK